MRRLYVACEGLTEVNFVTAVLKPHLEGLADHKLSVSAPNLKGFKTYAALRKDLKRLLVSGDVTTMIDLFKLASDFPGRAESVELPPVDRVAEMERRFGEDIADSHFVPYLQLHEFEALVLADLRPLARRHPNREREIADLERRLRQFPTPEHVNRMQPPSYWITQFIPEYNKTLDGMIVTAETGLPALRERCPHFGQWIDQLGKLQL